MSEVKSLAAKMAAIMGDVPTMIKNGQNVQQKYAYVTAEDVKASLRPLLKKHKVAVFSSMVGVDRKEGTTKSGGASMTTVAHMRFVLACGDSGETMQCEWFGESTDYGDKSVNKAATAAEKYFLINTFLLSTTEPDADEEAIEVVPFANPVPVSTSIPDSLKMKPATWERLNTLATKRFGDEWKDEDRRKKFAAYVSKNQTADIMSLLESEALAAIEGLEKKLAEMKAAAETEPTPA